jgi:pimeloyl-ACP methyl ester carboxylesterase
VGKDPGQHPVGHGLCLRSIRMPRVIPDLRGFGWSEAPGSGYSPTGFADDAVALLDALDIARAHVIGHDWGGFAGFLLGLHHSERVDRLRLCNSPGPWARLSPRTAVGLRRSWYAGLVATPILGHRTAGTWRPRLISGDPVACRPGSLIDDGTLIRVIRCDTVGRTYDLTMGSRSGRRRVVRIRRCKVSLTTVDLLSMSHDELDELFRASPAGLIPTGEGDGNI